MSQDLSPPEQFLLEEYRSASHLTYHIDELRNKLTSFFLIFAGLGVGGLTLIVKGEARNLFEPQRLVSGLLIVIGMIGFVVIGILARLRKVQLEHFRIINNVRTHFLKDDKDLWNVVELSAATLPMPDTLSPVKNRASGSYLWAFIIIFTNSVILVCAFYILAVKTYFALASTSGRLISAGLVLVLLLIQDRAYFRLARPPRRTT